MKIAKKILMGAALLSLVAGLFPTLAAASGEADFATRVDAINARISHALDRGDLTPPQADRLHQQLNSVRNEEHTALYDYGSLSENVEARLMSRLDSVNGNLNAYTGRFATYSGYSS